MEVHMMKGEGLIANFLQTCIHYESLLSLQLLQEGYLVMHVEE